MSRSCLLARTLRTLTFVSSCSELPGRLDGILYLPPLFAVDRILFLENGRLVEQGTHEELMELGGRYAELFDLQAASYR
jgi:hypothetical protein